MPHLRPPTLTKSETAAILRATAGHPRDHAIYSLVLGTGLRLAEIVGLNAGDVFAPDGTPRCRDLILAQRFARHVSPLTTTVYTHPSDDEMWDRVRGL